MNQLSDWRTENIILNVRCMMGVYDVLMNVMMKSRHLLSSSFIVDDIMADYFLQTETQIRLFNIIETKCKNLTTDF